LHAWAGERQIDTHTDASRALKVFSGGAGLAAGMAAMPGPLQAAQSAARRGMPPLKITDVKVIMTQPAGANLMVVKVLTSEPGLYGVGCATHQEQPFPVAAYMEKHLKPFVIGKNCDEIEDIWQSAYGMPKLYVARSR
jgi:mannonate dehydratase